MMKAITILQPFASLIPLGEKTIETRCWKTSYRGKIAIHAGLGMQYFKLAFQEPFKTALKPIETENGGYNAKSFYLGHVIAIAELVDCLEMIDDFGTLENGDVVTGNELAFGDYSQGRFAWRLKDIQAIKPVPARGMQRIWNWTGEGA